MTDPTPAEALKADWHCPICLCRSYAPIDQQIPDGTFAPGPRIRCVDCKRDWLLPIPPSPTPDAREVRERPGIFERLGSTGDRLLGLSPSSSTTSDAGEMRTYREGVERACEAFEEAISKGYPTPTDKREKCAHGSFGWQDCIACYDEALAASIAAIRKLP